MLCAHGKGELIDDWAARFGPECAAGLGVLLVEDPGFGRSAGSPSEASIRATMRAAYDAAAARTDVDASRIVGHDLPLGGGAIATLMRERKLRAVILESTFTSVADVASEHWLPGWLMGDRFDIESALREFRGPTLLLHGRRDALTPTRCAFATSRSARCCGSRSAGTTVAQIRGREWRSFCEATACWRRPAHPNPRAASRSSPRSGPRRERRVALARTRAFAAARRGPLRRRPTRPRAR